MAKPPKAHDQEGEISFTLVKFGMKGSDPTLQKGLDAIKAAFQQAGFMPVPAEARNLIRANGAKQLGAPVEDRDAEEADEVVDVEEAGEVAAPAPSPRRTTSQRKSPNYKVIKDLVIDDVSPTLEEFCAEKDPQSDLDRYKCIAYWFKHHKATPDLTVEYFFTVYMLLGWKLPKNAGNPVSDLRKQQVFIAGEKFGTSTINNLGEKQVRELRKKDA